MSRRQDDSYAILPIAGSRSSSPTPLEALYASKDFQLEWDNDLVFHVARSVIRLRRHRHYAQAALAKRVGTSQAKVARIEGGDANVTVRTVERFAKALSGRIRFTIMPAECPALEIPDWDVMLHGLAGTGDQKLVKFHTTVNVRGEAKSAGLWRSVAASTAKLIEEDISETGASKEVPFLTSGISS